MPRPAIGKLRLLCSAMGVHRAPFLDNNWGQPTRDGVCNPVPNVFEMLEF